MEYDDYNPDERSASFNDALAMIERMDAFIRRAQDAKVNPFAMNFLFGVPNYQVVIKSLQSHWQEVKSYCTDGEKEIVEKYWKIVNTLMNYVIIKKNGVSVINEKTYSKLEEVLTNLESLQRRLSLVHGLSNPLKDMSIGL